METFDIYNVQGHYEVFLNGKFVFSADNLSEVVEEAEKLGIQL